MKCFNNSRGARPTVSSVRLSNRVCVGVAFSAVPACAVFPMAVKAALVRGVIRVCCRGLPDATVLPAPCSSIPRPQPLQNEAAVRSLHCSLSLFQYSFRCLGIVCDLLFYSFPVFVCGASLHPPHLKGNSWDISTQQRREQGRLHSGLELSDSRPLCILLFPTAPCTSSPFHSETDLRPFCKYRQLFIGLLHYGHNVIIIQIAVIHQFHKYGSICI